MESVILIAVLCVAMRRFGNSPGTFGGANPTTLPEFPGAGGAPQAGFRYSAQPSPCLTHSCICSPIDTRSSLAAVPALSPFPAAQPVPGPVGVSWGHPESPTAGRESQAGALGLCSRVPQPLPPPKWMRGTDLFYSV